MLITIKVALCLALSPTYLLSYVGANVSDTLTHQSYMARGVLFFGTNVLGNFSRRSLPLLRYRRVGHHSETGFPALHLPTFPRPP